MDELCPLSSPTTTHCGWDYIESTAEVSSPWGPLVSPFSDRFSLWQFGALLLQLPQLA